MATSKKDFVAIARIISGNIEAADDGVSAVAAIEVVALELADHFRRTNEAFDRARFLKACGVKE